MKQSKGRELLFVFSYFFKISWFTFGGGWSIVTQMQKDFVEYRKELTDQELLDIVSVGRSLPGTMIGNVAYLYGYHRCGWLGGLAALTGMILPPMFILLILTFCYTKVRDNVYAAKVLAGVRAAVVPIIAAAAVKLRKGAFPRKICYVICGAACVLTLCFHVSCVIVILGGLAAGLLMGKYQGVEA